MYMYILKETFTKQQIYKHVPISARCVLFVRYANDIINVSKPHRKNYEDVFAFRSTIAPPCLCIWKFV